MATGLKVPVGVGNDGGLQYSKSDLNDFEIIAMALSDCSNENAFQQEIGLGSDFIFDISDSSVKAFLQNRIVSIFAKFEADLKYKLVHESLEWTDGEGSLSLSFRYLNLESDEEKEFTFNFGKGGIQ